MDNNDNSITKSIVLCKQMVYPCTGGPCAGELEASLHDCHTTILSQNDCGVHRFERIIVYAMVKMCACDGHDGSSYMCFSFKSRMRTQMSDMFSQHSHVSHTMSFPNRFAHHASVLAQVHAIAQVVIGISERSVHQM